jgi:protein-L-isoaspartate(D-aspartate) O-methyltransferase
MNKVLNRFINRFPLLLLAALLALQIYAPSVALAENFADLRDQMVRYQLKGRDIVDARVLRAMSVVPRHRFVPEKLQKMAYQDSPLPIGHGQTISQPYIVALMSQLLAVESGQRILEIGTGSGYQAGVLAEMGASVYSIEIVPELGRQARKALDPLGYETIFLKIGDGYQGWPQYAPFDGIIVTCAPTRIPEPLKTQLAEGGRMVIPVGPRHHQQLVLLTKERGKIRQEKVVDVRFVPMVDASGKTY